MSSPWQPYAHLYGRAYLDYLNRKRRERRLRATGGSYGKS